MIKLSKMSKLGSANYKTKECADKPEANTNIHQQCRISYYSYCIMMHIHLYYS